MSANQTIWKPAEVTQLIKLYYEGWGLEYISKQLNRSFRSVEQKIQYMLKSKYITTRSVKVPENYQAPEEPDFDSFFRLDPNQNYICFSDTHCPFFHRQLFEDYIFELAVKKKIKYAIINGDFLNMEAVSSYISGDKGKDHMTKEFNKADYLLSQCLKVFKKIYITQGNHEARLYKQLGGTVDPCRFFKMLGDYIGTKPEDKKPVLVSNYPYCFVGDNWLIGHPKGYSSRGGQMAADIADAYERNVILGHNHQFGIQTSKSGRFIGIDHGMSADPKKIEYYNMNLTNGRRWQVGFSMLIDNYGYAINYKHSKPKFWIK